MTNKDTIMQIVHENNGNITAKQVSDRGVSRGSLKYLVDIGILEHTSRGVYTLPEVWEDEIFSLQVRYKRGIFSKETALFLLGYTDRTPHVFNMTFPINYNAGSLQNENVNFDRVKKELYGLGIVDIKTTSGNMVKVYSIERTLCDILKSRSQTDIQIISDAFKRYAKSNIKNIPLLSEYAKQLRVEKKVRSYIEVLL